MGTHQKSFGFFILLVAAIFSLTLPTGISHQKQAAAAGAKQKGTTPMQERRMTEKQREHSKLYKDYKPDGNLRALAESSAGDVEVVNGIPQKFFTRTHRHSTYKSFYEAWPTIPTL